MLLFGRKIENIKYVERNAIESFNQDLWITTRGRKASTENVKWPLPFMYYSKCALKLKYGAIEKIYYISSENLFKASKRNDYDSGKTFNCYFLHCQTQQAVFPRLARF
jgi:hypothetical protein